jgi:DNA-binding PadR family transcriptional regulator
MTAKRSLPRTPLALAVMNLLHERPLHPYEMHAKMKERGHDNVIKIKGGSLYDTVERLERGGFIKALETSREGRRPERTVYTITESGRDELNEWLRELVATPVKEYPQFAAALAFFAGLDKEDVVRLLRMRTVSIESTLAASRKQIQMLAEMGLPRLFMTENEYGLAMGEAELQWTRNLIEEIEHGKLWLTKAEMEQIESSLIHHEKEGLPHVD